MELYAVKQNIIQMKKVEAIIRKTRFDDVREALNEAGIEFIQF